MERELESSKIQLCLKPDFNLPDAFRMIDCEDRGWIEPQQLETFVALHVKNFQVSRDDIYLFFRRYDRSKANKMTRIEFENAILPYSTEYQSFLQNREEFYASKSASAKDHFSPETESELQEFYRALFMNLKMMESLRVRIARRPHFSYKDAFDFCDRGKDGYLDAGDIKDMLSQFCFYATEREVASILGKFDKDCDGRISFHEFIDEITPKLAY